MQDKHLVENYNVRLEIFFAAPKIFPLRRFEGQQSVKPTKWLFEVEELVRSISFPPNLLWVPTILSSSTFQNFEKSLVNYDLPLPQNMTSVTEHRACRLWVLCSIVYPDQYENLWKSCKHKELDSYVFQENPSVQWTLDYWNIAK